jgi:hypothetical protein
MLLKHKLSETTTASVTTGLNLRKLVADSKTKALPLGIQFDVKL